MEIKPNDSLNWRWKQLEKDFEDAEEPRGISEIIDAWFWGKQNWQQKELSREINKRCLKRIKWKKKGKKN